MSKAKLIDGLVLRSSTQNYYLTWRAMSSQNGILNQFDSKKLWTVPSKEQYLPSYFKKLCDIHAGYFLLRLVKLLCNLIAQKQMIFFISVARSTEPVQKKGIKPHRVWFEIGYHYQWLSGEC